MMSKYCFHLMRNIRTAMVQQHHAYSQFMQINICSFGQIHTNPNECERRWRERSRNECVKSVRKGNNVETFQLALLADYEIIVLNYNSYLIEFIWVASTNKQNTASKCYAPICWRLRFWIIILLVFEILFSFFLFQSKYTRYHCFRGELFFYSLFVSMRNSSSTLQLICLPTEHLIYFWTIHDT